MNLSASVIKYFMLLFIILGKVKITGIWGWLDHGEKRKWPSSTTPYTCASVCNTLQVGHEAEQLPNTTYNHYTMHATIFP